MAYISKTEVKLDLGISDTTYDTILDAYCDYATGIIDSYLGRSLEQDDYTEKFITKVTEYPDLYTLKYLPLNNITSVKIDGTALDSDEYEVRTSQGVVLLLQYTTGAEVEIAYNAGYASDSIPDDIKFVARRLVATLFQNRDGTIVSSESAGSWDISFTKQDITASLNKLIESFSNILDRYINVAI